MHLRNPVEKKLHRNEAYQRNHDSASTLKSAGKTLDYDKNSGGTASSMLWALL